MPIMCYPDFIIGKDLQEIVRQFKQTLGLKDTVMSVTREGGEWPTHMYVHKYHIKPTLEMN